MSREFNTLTRLTLAVVQLRYTLKDWPHPRILPIYLP